MSSAFTEGGRRGLPPEDFPPVSTVLRYFYRRRNGQTVKTTGAGGYDAGKKIESLPRAPIREP